jgi:hypothetical protein
MQHMLLFFEVPAMTAAASRQKSRGDAMGQFCLLGQNVRKAKHLIFVSAGWRANSRQSVGELRIGFAKG